MASYGKFGGQQVDALCVRVMQDGALFMSLKPMSALGGNDLTRSEVGL